MCHAIGKSVLCWLVVGALAGGLLQCTGCGEGAAPAPAETPSAEQAPKAEEWTCPMHPQVREAKAGRCPTCGMDLVPASRNAEPDEGS